MEPKKDISLYKTKDSLNKSKSISPANNNSSAYKDKRKDVVSHPGIKENNFNSFVNKKTKKLTTAVYMVTSFLSDNEPLKWEIRKCSVSLFSGISNVRNKSVSEVDNVFTEYLVVVDEIMSLLEIATVSKIVSEMNYSILKKEYSILKNIISSEEYMEEKAGKFIFSDGFFDKDNVLPQSHKKDLISHSNINIYKKDISNSELLEENKQENLTEASKAHLLDKGQNNAKRQQLQTRHIKDRDMSDRKNEGQNKIKTNKRRDVVLRLFKNKKGKEFTIKDISYEVSDCSEKTIQRELVSLVAEGMLKKYGERRWSRYSLK